MQKRRFDVVFVDYYGTLACGDRRAVEETCSHIVRRFGLDLSVDAFAKRWGGVFFEVLSKSNDDAFQTLHECETRSLETMLSTLGVKTDARCLVDRLEHYWMTAELHPDAMPFLESLDLPVCCVSNADKKPLANVMKRHGLQFDAVVTSEATRSYKPHAGIFREALKTMGTTPQRTIHIGDSLFSDIAGAAALGIASVWIHRPDRIHDLGGPAPHWTVSSLTDVLSVLAGDP